MDDAADTRRLLEMWSGRAGLKADGAASGTEALDLVRSRSYDLLVIDLNLGQESGREVLARVRDEERRLGRAPAPAAAATATLSPELEAECLGAGFMACLEKPLSHASWLAWLDRALERGGPASAPPAGDGSIDDLVPEYLGHRRDDLEVMTAALARADWATVESLAHKVKGSGASYGFPELTALARELEKAAAERREAEVRDGLDRWRRFLDGAFRHPVPRRGRR